MRVLVKGLLASLLTVCATDAVYAATVRAGEWETVMDGGRQTLVCFHSDRSFDQATLAKMMTNAGIKCVTGRYSSLGPVVSVSMVCNVAGGRMTTDSTITTTGMDAYVTHSKSHLEGGSIKMPDMDLTQTARRLGECKPGDRSSPY